MFKVSEILKATGGRLLSGSADAIVKDISIDSRVVKPGDAFIAIKGNRFDGHKFVEAAVSKGASCIICAPQIIDYRLQDIAVIQAQDTTQALGDIARFNRERFNIPVITITGSNGKTTTKEMIAHVLAKKFKVLKNIGTENNHIGLPMTLLNLNDYYDFAVLEAGTNHPGEIEYLARIAQPNIAAITNIGQSHLKYLKDTESVFYEKTSLLRYLREPAVALLNADDRWLSIALNQENKGFKAFGFGVNNNADIKVSDMRFFEGCMWFIVNSKYKFKLNTIGAHNIYNALIAIFIARVFGMEYKDIALQLSSFEFPKSRLKLLELEKIKFIDDTYNSNPLSLRHALDVLAHMEVRGRKIFVMGDMLELGADEEFFHRQAGENAAKSCDYLITVGRLSQLAAQVARDGGFNNDKVFNCKDIHEAREVLLSKIIPQAEDIVLVKGSRSMRMEEIFKA
ncbi:MAG: UDP-N-acetylmuramoyl-tripeptide--D-alanyl-D-alanine ligase [Candidatus Omnitrophota bacterium]